MKIATFNINNVNKRLANLLRWLREAEPDVVCLQELKAAEDALPEAALEAAGYGSVWRGQRTKLAWFDRLIRHAATLKAAGIPVVLAGDYNVVPTDLDIYPTTSWDNDALLQPESRAAFRTLLAQGWTDAVRTLHPEERIYTFWDYKRDRWRRNGGLRLDHLLLSRDMRKRLKSAGVDREVRGEEGASDHAPAWIVVR